MAETPATMLEAACAKAIRPFTVPDRIPGYGIHEVGVPRMGRDPKNLFVMDSAGFTSSACQNPTLTIKTLCVRCRDYLLRELKEQNI